MSITESELGEREAGLRDTLDLYQERIADLELALEDRGWRKPGSIGGEHDFSRSGLQKIIEWARTMYLGNPLINRAVDVQSFYVWGQGVSIQAKHPRIQEVVSRFLDDPHNQAEITSPEAQAAKEVELQTDANIFFAFFTHEQTGRVRVSTIPIDEIQDIITNPDNRKEPWFYKRVWAARKYNSATGKYENTTQTEMYPDFRYRPRLVSRAATYEGYRVNWDTPVYHRKVGGMPNMKFGVPEVFTALPWATAYKRMLENDVQRSEALAKFALKLTAKGGRSAVTAARDRMASLDNGHAEGTPRETANPNSRTWIQNENVSMEAMRVSGATMPTDHSKPARLMVASGTGLPDTILSGDVDQGNFATSKTMDRPTELRYHMRQVFWTGTFLTIIGYAIEQAVRRPLGALRGLATIEKNLEGEEYIAWGTERDEAGNQVEIDPTVEATFPDILEHDVAGHVQIILEAVAAGLVPKRAGAQAAMTELGFVDVDGYLEELFPEGEEQDPPVPPPAESTTEEGRRDPKALTEAANPKWEGEDELRDRVAAHFERLSEIVPADEWAKAAEDALLIEGRARVVAESDRKSIEPIIRDWQESNPGRKWSQELEDLINEQYGFAFNAGGQDALGKLAVQGNFQLRNPEVIDYLKTFAGERVVGIDEHTRRTLAKVIAESFDSGNGVEQIGREIRFFVKDMSVDRAQMIAQAETAFAMGKASHETYKRSGVEEKEWLTTGDEAVCVPCSSNGSQGAIAIDEAFTSGHQFPPADPRCRCAILPVIPDDWSSESAWKGE